MANKRSGIMTTPPKTIIKCLYCGNLCDSDDLYDSDSLSYRHLQKIPYCKDCLISLYESYLDKFQKLEYIDPEKMAIERMCMILNLYFEDSIYDSVFKKNHDKPGINLFSVYMRQIHLKQHKKKSYDITIEKRHKQFKIENELARVNLETEKFKSEEIKKATKIFGSGFELKDYEFLYEQYHDWTTRHECNTKAQEEVFKRICFKQLEILKATQAGEDTKNLDATFQNLLETANLQPKQNGKDTMSDAQTFGTLIDKWENTRPIPEIDDDLKDVDKIGLLIHVFFTGHMAKVLNLKSSLVNLYEKYIKKYTVEKQEYSSDSDNEALFDSIFGKKNIDV